MSTTVKTWLGVLAALVLALFVVFVWALLLRGPGGVDGAVSASPTPSESSEGMSASAEPEESATPDASVEPSPSPSVSASAELTPIPAGAIVLPSFAMPSGNIGCVIDDDGAACQIGDSTFTGPGVPTCDTGGRLVLMDESGVAVECFAGPEAPIFSDASGLPVLEYGQTSTVGPWLCTSSNSGLECTSRADGTGFRLSRALFTSYGPGRLM